MIGSSYGVKRDKGSDHMTHEAGHTHDRPPDLILSQLYCFYKKRCHGDVCFPDLKFRLLQSQKSF